MFRTDIRYQSLTIRFCPELFDEVWLESCIVLVWKKTLRVSLLVYT